MLSRKLVVCLDRVLCLEAVVREGISWEEGCSTRQLEGVWDSSTTNHRQVVLDCWEPAWDRVGVVYLVSDWMYVCDNVSDLTFRIIVACKVRVIGLGGREGGSDSK